MKVLVSDPLGKRGMDILNKDKSLTVEENTGLKPAELKKIIGNYEAIIIRSGTRLTRDILEKAKKLRVIGRAGVGVDNVDIEAATERGIVVMNTPEGNTISTAEHTFSVLMSVARNIPQADASVKSGEWNRGKFKGAELKGKTLGVVGFGRIGREVALRAHAFKMKIVVFDPFLNKDSIQELPIEVVELNPLLKQADFITVHTPLTKDTKHLLNEKSLKLCKKGVRIINCARGGIIDEGALYKALKSGHVAGAGFDVYEEEPPKDNPLLTLANFVSTPHLGAATLEAQENVAVDVAKQVIDALHERSIRNAVNQPNIDPETLKGLKPWIQLAEKMGLLHSQVFSGGFKKVEIRYGGDPAKYNCAPLTITILKGLLTPICGDTVNFVNAPSLAKSRGITVTESKSEDVEDFSSYIEIVAEKGKEKNVIMGTLFGDSLPRIVRLNEFSIDVEPSGWMVFIRNEDQPGVVGKVGDLLGKAKVNIAEMSLGRVKKGRKMYALTVINTDEEVSSKVVKQIENYKPVIDVKLVKV